MPTFAMPVRDATNQSERILSLWQGSWIAALAVGAITWGLILWPAIAFRRKRGATDLPPQTRYNLPIEVFYTAVPIIMIAVFFYFTARDEDRIMRVSSNPDHSVRTCSRMQSATAATKAIATIGLRLVSPSTMQPVMPQNAAR